MNITVLGLGYVGCVTTACLARNGHQVTGVDINPEKVATIQKGKSPIIEPGLAELLQSGVAAGQIWATCDTVHALEKAELTFICVGTPSQSNGALDFTFLERVCRDVGKALKYKKGYIVVAVRSTVLPGTAQERLIPILEAESGRKAGPDFGFCINPEFLREGSAIRDFDHPPYSVIGQLDERSGGLLAQLYSQVDAPRYQVPLGVAEMVKYACNAFHALKVVFANEIGNVCQAYGVDSHQVMDIFVQDTKLNLSPNYFRPGFAFGGSCLGKDMRALLFATRQRSLRTPVLEAVLPSNHLQIERALEMVLEEGRNKIGLIGLSFKPNTDDLRESPAVELAERLIGKGLALCIYDREVSLTQLHGSNRAYLERVIPHIRSLMRPSLEEIAQEAEIIVVTKRLPEDEYKYFRNLLHRNHVVIDLVRFGGTEIPVLEGKYRGICW